MSATENSSSPKTASSNFKKRRCIPANNASLPLFGPGSEETVTMLKDIRPLMEHVDLDPANDSVGNLNEVKGPGVSQLSAEVKKKLYELQISTSMTCASCKITFDSREEQSSHFKTDWHRYNLKQRVKGLKSVTEMDFMATADAISSLSGTDSDSSDEDSNRGKISKYKLQEKIGLDTTFSDDEAEVMDGSDKILYGSAQSKLYLRTSSGQIISIYRAILCNKKEQIGDTNELLHLIELLPSQSTWMVIMMGGGHFAAAVFQNGEVIAHKTFHRYVVRAKAGTSQSQHDKKGGHAQSAGAQIRRHNEAALAQEITDLLQSWKDHIDHCHKIFIRVGTHNYPYIFNKKEKSHLSKSDQRITAVPFPTRRATFNEVRRVYSELTTVRVYDPKAKLPKGLSENFKKPSSSQSSESATDRKSSAPGKSPSRRRQDEPHFEQAVDDQEQEADIEYVYGDDVIDTTELEEYSHYISVHGEAKENKQSGKKKKNKSRKMKDEPTEQERSILPYQTEFYTACVVGDVEQLKSLVESHREEITLSSADFSAGISQPVTRSGQTLLHIACINSHRDLVTYLLDAGCNPAFSDDKKTVPYLSTQNKTIRNTFRFFMADHPDKYDYIKAQIPGPLSREEFAEKEAKEAERRKEVNKKKKEKMKAKKQESSKQRAEDEEKKRFLALSDREKRALAAERRLLNQAGYSVTEGNPVSSLTLKRCYQCATDITGKVPFEYSDNVFCSPVCLKAHRMLKNST